MAERPWVTPDEVIAYSDYKLVQNRSFERLKLDITRAEAYVIAYTNNTFCRYKTIPDDVKAVVILLAEAYAYNSSADERTGARRLNSETFDDYSYTAGDGGGYISIDDLFSGLKSLLDPYVIIQARGNVTMRLRRL